MAIYPQDASSKTLKIQKFTSSGTWTRPAGFAGWVKVRAWGGGGSGGSNDWLTANWGPGGGGGGAYAEEWIQPVANITVTIGAGGAGATNHSDGNAGGNTTVSDGTTTITALGGGAGKRGGPGGDGGTGGGAAGGGTLGAGGGGGGAGGPGQNASFSQGGVGLSSSMGVICPL